MKALLFVLLAVLTLFGCATAPHGNFANAKFSNAMVNFRSVRFNYNQKAAKPLSGRVLSDLGVSTI
jgi:outer membrane lipoprotein-sorting protein